VRNWVAATKRYVPKVPTNTSGVESPKASAKKRKIRPGAAEGRNNRVPNGLGVVNGWAVGGRTPATPDSPKGWTRVLRGVRKWGYLRLDTKNTPREAIGPQDRYQELELTCPGMKEHAKRYAGRVWKEDENRPPGGEGARVGLDWKVRKTEPGTCFGRAAQGRHRQ